MAMTPAQRQAAFRERHSTTKSRLNSLVSNDAKYTLVLLAYQYGITESAMLERLLESVEHLIEL